MAVEVKICGLSTEETVDAAVAAGARWVGFNIYPPSPRYVDTATMKALGARVPAKVGRVAVMVDPDDGLLDERLATGVIDVVQLHGSETPERVAAIKARTGKPVMKVIKVTEPGDVERGIATYGSVADQLMFDAAEGILPGGNATSFDWTMLSGRTVPLPWLLAGGLTPANVGEAIRLTGAPTVDVSSGVEASRGVKSAELIRAFIAAVRGAAVKGEKA